MQVRIKYFGQLREIAKADEEQHEPSESCGLKEVLLDRSEFYGGEFRRILFNKEEMLRPSVMILVNGNPIDKENPPDLNDGDEVNLLAAIGGG